MAAKIRLPTEWNKILPELLPLIAQKLGDITDFIRFRAVCKRWRSATNLSDSPPQFPWLMQIKGGDDESEDVPEIVFHCLPSCRTFSISFPEALPMIYKHDICKEFLLEEFDEKDLNKFDTHTIFDVKFDRLGRDVSHREVVPLPPVGVLPKLLNLDLSGKNKQLLITFPVTKAIACHKGTIFFWATDNATGLPHIHVKDDATGKNLSTFPCRLDLLVDLFLEINCWLISTTDGPLMVVQYASPEVDVRYEDFRFVVYRMEYHDRKPYWTKLSTIGDLMLFLDEHNSFGLMANEYNGFSGNCIYFITKLKESLISRSTQYILVGYNMAEQKSSRCVLWKKSPAPVIGVFVSLSQLFTSLNCCICKNFHKPCH